MTGRPSRPSVGSSPPRWGGSRAPRRLSRSSGGLFDRVDLTQGAARDAARRDRQRPGPGATQAAHGEYPRGVTILPEITVVGEEPMTRHVVMLIESQSSSPSVVTSA